jgi:hypothetical protein
MLDMAALSTADADLAPVWPSSPTFHSLHILVPGTVAEDGSNYNDSSMSKAQELLTSVL